MELLSLRNYDVICFDSSAQLIGASKEGKFYHVFKGKLCNGNLFTNKVPSIKLSLKDDLSADINISITKEDFFNVFGFLPKKTLLDSNFDKLIPKTIHIEDISNVFSVINRKVIEYSVWEKTIEKAFLNPEFADHYQKDSAAQKEIKFEVEAYFTLKLFDNIIKF